jgi:hypothetical protein
VSGADKEVLKARPADESEKPVDKRPATERRALRSVARTAERAKGE